MATFFKGLALCPPRQERPSHVRVRDAEGGEVTLPLDQYEAHGGQPPWQSLPWQDGPEPVPEAAGEGPGPETGA